MKRTIQFQLKDDNYIFIENEETIFLINKGSLQLEVKKLYEAFFANGKDYSEIEIITSAELSKEDKRVFDTISQLIGEICTRLKEEIHADDEVTQVESIDAYKMPDHVNDILS